MVEVTLANAKYHVQRYQVQRNWARKVVVGVRLDITYRLPFLFCRKVLPIDMGQNLCLPNFEGKQPGNIYYMSPLTVRIFGVVNNSTNIGQDRMNAYIWQQFEGYRVQKNITLYLLMDLQIRGWLSTPNYDEVTYIINNCGKQNKNMYVVRFSMWLVEVKIFPKESLLFLVKGHTKNLPIAFSIF